MIARPAITDHGAANRFAVPRLRPRPWSRVDGGHHCPTCSPGAPSWHSLRNAAPERGNAPKRLGRNPSHERTTTHDRRTSPARCGPRSGTPHTEPHPQAPPSPRSCRPHARSARAVGAGSVHARVPHPPACGSSAMQLLSSPGKGGAASSWPMIEKRRRAHRRRAGALSSWLIRSFLLGDATVASRIRTLLRHPFAAETPSSAVFGAHLPPLAKRDPSATELDRQPPVFADMEASPFGGLSPSFLRGLLAASLKEVDQDARWGPPPSWWCSGWPRLPHFFLICTIVLLL